MHPKMRFYLRLFFVLLTCVGLLVSGCTVMREITAHAMVRAPNHGQRSMGEPTAAEQKQAQADAHLRIAVGPPAASMSVWIFNPKPGTRRPPRGTILVLHGIRDQKRTMARVGQGLAAKGYRTVLVDLRGHGKSTGDWLTYGVQESADLQQVLNALERQELLSGPLGVYGGSYGAACGILLAARDPRVRAVVAAATFSSLREVAPDYAALVPLGKLIAKREINRAVDRAGALAHFDPDAASPAHAMGKTRAPILLIHGTDDRNIPFRHAQRNRLAGEGHVELLAVQGANHRTIFDDRSGELTRNMHAWFDRWLR